MNLTLSPLLKNSIRDRDGRLTWPAVQVRWQTILTAAGLLGLFVALLAAVQFATPALAGNDGYYHIKLAQVMRQQGLRPPFPWLPLTVLNPADYYDHHWLYHVLLIPFTFGDLRLGAKWASVVFPAFTFLAGWWVMRGQRVPYAALWAAGFLGVSEAFLYRMSMPRAQALSLLVLFLALHVTFTRRYRWLTALAFIYVWLYNAFPLILLLVGVYVGLHWLFERRLNLWPLVYAGAGVTLGLLINPYFPDNLVFIYHHLLPKLTDATATKVGNEWYPYKTWTLVENSGPALAALAAGVFALGWSNRRMSLQTATVLVITMLFGLMLFKSRRFVEYFPAFALLFCAMAWGPVLAEWRQSGGRLARLMPLALALLIIPAIWLSVPAAQASLQRSKPADLYAGAAEWLQENSPAGSRVFQSDWDDFTRLFYHNTHNTYTLGLDPTYMELYDPNLYTLWVDISKGRVENPAGPIETRFGAAYVLTDLNHKEFIRAARADNRLEEVYRDDQSIIFKVINTSPAGNGKEGANVQN